MIKSSVSSFFIGTIAIIAGCANQQTVKKDQAISPVASSVLAPAAKPVPSGKEEKHETNDHATASKTGPNEAANANVVLKERLDEIFFDFDSYKLSAQAREVLTINANILKQKPKVKIRIEGNCDELGSDEYNLALGEKRAMAALNYLESLGLPPERLSTISYGKEKPVDLGHDAAARARNRRDEFVIISK